MISILKIFQGKLKRDTFLVALIVMLAALLDVVTITMVIPFLSVFLSNNVGIEYIDRLMVMLREFLGDNFTVKISILFIAFNIFSACLRIFAVNRQARFSHKVGFELSTLLFDRIIARSFSDYKENTERSIVSALSIKINRIYPTY